ncbi:MAG TPA: hypothetical protein VEY33_09115 [Gemmatimonadota bacterium]|nr:hypothetical protein [Gemmatimonadota bacterium]
MTCVILRAWILLVLAACSGGPFGREGDDEDHRFLIDLRNISFDPVTLKLADEPSGFVVQAISVMTIQRTAEPGHELVFEALIDETVLVQTTSCRYAPPSDASPRRRVSWDGSSLRCLNWD